MYGIQIKIIKKAKSKNWVISSEWIFINFIQKRHNFNYKFIERRSYTKNLERNRKKAWEEMKHFAERITQVRVFSNRH